MNFKTNNSRFFHKHNRQHKLCGRDKLTMAVSWVHPQTSSSSLMQWWRQVNASHTGLSVKEWWVSGQVPFVVYSSMKSGNEFPLTSYLFWSSAAFLIHMIFSFFSMVLQVPSIAFWAFGRSFCKAQVCVDWCFNNFHRLICFFVLNLWRQH